MGSRFILDLRLIGLFLLRDGDFYLRSHLSFSFYISTWIAVEQRYIPLSILIYTFLFSSFLLSFVSHHSLKTEIEECFFFFSVLPRFSFTYKVPYACYAWKMKMSGTFLRS